MMNSLAFGQHYIGPGHPTLIIAEIGINHEGDLPRCLEMVHAASEAGADAIKLQTIDANANYTPSSPSYALFKQVQFSPEQILQVFEEAQKYDIEFFSTCGDIATLEAVNTLNPSAHKISSGLHTHIPIIKAAAKTGRPILISTGMGTMESINDAIQACRECGNEQIALFQCTSIYPANHDQLNLAVIRTLQQTFNLPVGFSDHSVGIAAAPLAVAAGAQVIEKHFTFDSNRSSYDHRLSLEPQQFKRMVENIRTAETMLGSSEKQLTGIEAENARLFLRTLVAADSFEAGHELTEQDVLIRRSGDQKPGFAPKFLHSIIGKRCKQPLQKNETITIEDIEP